MAEREGFEPPVELPPRRISSAVHSTTLPPLREVVPLCGWSTRPGLWHSRRKPATVFEPALTRPLFVYGTLRDPELLSAVLGRPLRAGEALGAVAPGFRAAEWAGKPLALELRYLRKFDGEDIARRSLDEMQRVGPIAPEQAALWLRTMTQAFPDVQRGDRLTGIYEPGVGVRFLHNGRTTANVRDPQFAQRFFAIWLGPKSSEPALREALLGKK